MTNYEQEGRKLVEKVDGLRQTMKSGEAFAKLKFSGSQKARYYFWKKKFAGEPK